MKVQTLSPALLFAAALAPAMASAAETSDYRVAGVNDRGMLVYVRPSDDARVVWIPAGAFKMNAYVGFATDDPPAEVVDVPGFAIDETEVTNARYCGFLGFMGVGADGRAGEELWVESVASGMQFDDVWRPRAGCDQWPAVGVTGFGALAYALWVGGDLPTIREWQKAAAGPDGLTYPWGEELPGPRHANYRRTGPGMPVPVGSYPAGASPYGVLDMAGNVYERVWTRRRGGEAQPVMIRGGSWASPHPLNVRTWDLCMQPMEVAERTVGFRCVVRSGRGLPEEPRQKLKLARSWDAAVKEATERNVPLLVSMHYDTCGQCDRTKVGLYRDPEFVSYVNEHVVFLGGQWPGDAEDAPHSPGADGACPYWPGLSCAEHIQIFADILNRVPEFRISPGTFVLDPRVPDEAEPAERILVDEIDLPKWGGGAAEFIERLREAQEEMSGTGE